jgi:hypothetical protein
MNTVMEHHEFKAGSMITLRQIAVDGVWPFPVELKDGEVPAMFEGIQCLDIDSYFSNDVYGQIVFKAHDVTEQCNGDLTFANEANGNFLTFKLKVVPLDMVRGELFEAQNFEMNTVNKVHLAANGMITFRQYSENGVFPFSVDYTAFAADYQCAHMMD